MYAYTLRDALRAKIAELELFITKLEVHRTEPFARIVDWNISEVQAQIDGLRAKLKALGTRQRVEELTNRVSVLRQQMLNANDSHQRTLIEFAMVGLDTRIEFLTSKLEVSV